MWIAYFCSMQWLQRLFRFYIMSNIHVAIAVCSLALITFLNFELEINWKLIGFIFCGAVSGYNFIKYFGLARFHHKRLAPWLRHIQIFAFLAFLGLVSFALQLEQKTLIASAILGIMTFFYAIPMTPKNWFVDKRRNLRAISGLKIYVISLVWTGVVVFLPIIDKGVSISHDVLVLGAQIYLYTWVATLPFEIRDLQYDSVKLATIPQQIGLNASKFIGLLLLTVILLLELFKDEFRTSELIVMSLVMLLLALMLLFSTSRQNQYYSSFWVEGIPVLWLGLMYWIH